MTLYLFRSDDGLELAEWFAMSEAPDEIEREGVTYRRAFGSFALHGCTGGTSIDDDRRMADHINATQIGRDGKTLDERVRSGEMVLADSPRWV